MANEFDQVTDERLARIVTPIVNAAIRQYFAQVARRYVGIAAAAIVLLLVAVTMPSKNVSATNADAAGVAGADGGGAAAGGPGATGVSATAGGAGGPLTAGSGAGATGTAGGATAAGGGTGPASAGAGPSTGGVVGQGVTVSGIKCSPGVRQVPWSVYAAPCMSAWQGDNGGATARGVTGTTITLFYRYVKECTGATGAEFNCDGTVKDAQALIGLMNKTFELYGRHVVLKTFNGQGSLVLEVGNQGQAQAQADAQTAYDLGAFSELADEDSSVFGDALANKHIMFPSITAPSESRMARESPYAHGTPLWESADNWARGIMNTACARMKGMPAIYAGDPVYQKTTRAFGLVNSNNPDWQQAGDIIANQGAKQCGLKLASHQTYDANFNSEAQQAPVIISQLKAANVTTVLAVTDVLMATVLEESADSQNYHPEWLLIEPYSTTRTAPVDQEQHAFKIGPIGPYLCPSCQEGWKAYQLATGGQSPAETAFTGIGGVDATFYPLLQIFNAIQMAGPILTPATFDRGWRAMPTAVGPYGRWAYGGRSGYQDADTDYVIARFNPNTTSKADGQKGEWQSCDGGTRYLYLNPTNLGSGQLKC